MKRKDKKPQSRSLVTGKQVYSKKITLKKSEEESAALNPRKDDYDYGEAEKFFWIHQDDPDLKPIRFDIDYIIRKNFLFWNPNHKGKIKIASPNPKKIANYGLPKSEQYWRREEMPPRLKTLEKRFGGVQTEIWEYLADHAKEYTEEIAFIKRQVYHLLYGYWFYNNGIPTYIDGWHWLHLSYATGSYETIDRKTLRKINTPHPEYRDRDRRKFLIWRFSLVDTQQFAHYDDAGVPIPNSDGWYDFVDTGRRVWYGTLNPKHRRDGATTNIITILLGHSMYLKNAYSSMIANRETTAEEHFNKKLIPTWRKMPFFFRPIHDGTDRPKKSLNFVAPASKNTEKVKTNASLDVLDTTIDFANITDRMFYDGNKIEGAILLDEEGKTTITDIFTGWGIVKPSMSQGGGSTINPYAISFHPSTVEEMESGGGRAYEKLKDNSDFFNRNQKTGQTFSGLFYFFLPAYDGLENFVGPYGESIIGDPTPEQAKFIKRDFGSKEYLEREKARLESKDDPDAREELDSFTRKHPTRFADCWIIKGGELGFDQAKLNSAIERLKKDKNATIKGNFLWEIEGQRYTAEEYLKNPKRLWSDYEAKGRVVFEPDRDGKWNVSKTLASPSLRERDYQKAHWRPKFHDKFVASADPVQFNLDGQAKLRSDKSKTSFPAGIVFEKLTEDDMVRPEEEWTSHTTVCDYCIKTNDDDVYCEEMLMMSIYYGALMYPEVNIRSIPKWFIDRGYAGYLKYDYDEVSGRYKTSPGFTTGSSAGGGVKDELFTELKGYIYRHIHRDKHLNIIMQMKLIKRKEEMTKFDLIPCMGGVLRSLKYEPRKIDYDYGKSEKELEGENIDLSEWYGNEH